MARFSAIPEDREIHRVVSCAQLDHLRTIFAEHNGRLKRGELRKVLAAIGLQYTDEQYRTLFLQINTDHDEFCQWDELLSYLILGFQDDDPLAVNQSLEPPISEEIALKLGRQVYTIARVDFCPMVYYDGSISWSQGHWITASREGVINFWTKEWKPSLKARSTPSRLKRSKTWVLDAIPLPDQRSYCVACLESELRFYDVVAGSFVLKTVIERLPHPISALDYCYKRGQPSKLLLGDAEGHVTVLELYPDRKVLVSGESFSIVTWVSWKDVIAGRYPPLEGIEYGQLLVDQVRMVRYVEKLNSLIAASEENPLTRRSGLNRSTAGSLPTMVLQSLGDRSSRTPYHVPRGVTCFAFEPITELLVSGGPDCDLRLWDIRRPEKPSAVLSGHTASIVFLFVQDAGEKVYSLDQKRIVKVWDVRNRVLLQTFTELTVGLAQNLPLCAFYDERERQLVVANNKLVCLSCCPEIPLDRTDGESHSRPISVLLYNSLYQLIISCGLDSAIITWDHCANRKMSLITEAHTQERNGLCESVEITAGCLDGKQQLLATGARDGSVKLWNISGRTCMRTFRMQEDCEVTALFWIANRVLAMGWNHRVVEFFASPEQEAEYPRGLPWRKLHSDDILCAAVSSGTPEALATCSYAGELVLWMLETGQPYRRYNAANPHIRIPISFQSDETETSAEPKTPDTRRKTIRMSLASRRTMVPTMDSRRLSRIVMPMALEQMRKLSIQVLMFLRSRPMHPAFGTLLGSLESGVIQVWSHDPNGGYRAQFNAIHMAGDRVIAMTSDASNRFLFTGTALGYIKTWYIENCWIPDADKFRVNKPSLRIRFPFLIDDIIPGRAKRSARSQPKPWLLNSFQAHRSCVTGLVYLERSELLLSSSSDRTVRLWTLGGRYIGLLGSPVNWEPLAADLPPAAGYRFRIPPDLRREVSFTTAKVLRGAKEDQRQFQHSSIGLERSRKVLPAIETYGCPLKQPLVNAGIVKLPPKEPVLPMVRLERAYLPSLPVYSHMTQFPLKSIAPGVDAKLEQILKKTKELQFVRQQVEQH